jgi:hypothetical protein
MRVKGGITLESGGINLAGQDFTSGSFHVISNFDNLGQPLISATATSQSFSGTMVQLKSNTMQSEDFSYVSAVDESDHKVSRDLYKKTGWKKQTRSWVELHCSSTVAVTSVARHSLTLNANNMNNLIRYSKFTTTEPFIAWAGQPSKAKME